MRIGKSAWPRSTSGKRAEFERRMNGDLPTQALADAVRAVKEKLAAAAEGDRHPHGLRIRA